jgi:membrane peptidoglycan carboxypeptidase
MGDPLGENSMSNVGGISVFGATYPADIWKAFMEAAHTNVPVVDFIAPDENQWPTPQRIDEYGRKQSTYYARSSPVTSPVTTPATIAIVPTTVPAPTTTAPPIVAPTTSPKPGKKHGTSGP